MKKTKGFFTTAAAMLLSVALHAAAIGGIAYGTGLFNSGTHAENREAAVKNARYTLLPDVEIISDKSMVKYSGKDALPERTDDFGSGKQAAAGDAADPVKESVFKYEDAVKRRIQEARAYPAGAKKDGDEGTVEILFSIKNNGRLEKASITRSSGVASLDNEAISTIKRASPFPGFPEYVKSDKMEMQVAIVFKLN